MQQEQRSRVALEQLACLVDHELESLVEPPQARDVRPDPVQGLRLPDFLLQVVLDQPKRVVVLLEALGHDVEVLPELADLVARRDADAGVEAPPGDAASRGRQPSQRCGDLAVEGHADDHEQADTEQQEDHVEGGNRVDEAAALLDEPCHAVAVQRPEVVHAPGNDVYGTV